MEKKFINLMQKKFQFIVIGFILFTFGVANANNVNVNTITLTGQNSTNHYIDAQFNLTWENSWRSSSAPNNWDAVWLFVKYKKSTGDTNWYHSYLSTNAGDHSVTNNNGVIPAFSVGTTDISDTARGMGVFAYRNADGTGSINWQDVKLRWNYGENGLTESDTVTVKVCAIEMVYVPQGSFYVGSGGSESGAFYKYPTITNTYQITGEGAITVGTATNNLYYQNTSGSSGDQLGPIPATFPKGYAAFYCMKYEISQQQYVDFLNTLTTTQANNRYTTGATGTCRYGISRSGGVYSTTNPYVACNLLSWSDLAAYFDWSGLRPMTELEFEKACRGTVAPVANEYAWGTTNVATNAYTLSNGGLTNEGIATNYSTTVGNMLYSLTRGTIGGPVRVGIFAGNVNNTGRITAGATYYGIMEMSGNLMEHPVTVGNPEGRLFTGTHGNGLLDASGNSDVSSWPGTNALGSGFRGGRWNIAASDSYVSQRIYAAATTPYRDYTYGGRGVRLAP